MNLYLRLLLLRIRSRRRGAPPLSLWDTAHTPFRVTPTDLDLLGHMNNGKYQTLMDVARLDLMTRSGTWSRIRERGWYAVVVGHTTTFRRSLTLGQRFVVESRVIGAHDRWTFVEHTFVRRGDVVAQGVVRSRFLAADGTTVSPEELATVIGPFPPDRVLPEWVPTWTAASRIAPRG